MKKIFLILIMFLSSLAGKAQEGMPKEGFWVIESNVKTPRKNFIRFYNHLNELIYEEEVLNKKININRAKVRKALTKVLQTLLNPVNVEVEIQNKRVLQALNKHV